MLPNTSIPTSEFYIELKGTVEDILGFILYHLSIGTVPCTTKLQQRGKSPISFSLTPYHILIKMANLPSQIF